MKDYNHSLYIVNY